MPYAISENEVEDVTLELLLGLGYKILHGPDIAPDGPSPERESYQDVVLTNRLKAAVDSLNPLVPEEAREEALKKVERIGGPSVVDNNHQFHRMLVDGVDVEYRDNGRIVGDKVWLFDFEFPENNEFLAINQFTVIEGDYNRRPDIVLFVNGLPLGIIELKNMADESATIWSAYNQLQTYKNQIPSIFTYNEALVISDGYEARAGTITSPKEWFLSWKTIEGKVVEPENVPQLQVLVKGMLDRRIFLDLVKNFVVFEVERDKAKKKISAYHQYHAVNVAVEKTLEATKPSGDKRAGVVWHTQGSGKSLIMVFYAGKLTLTLDNPTIVVLTDRNDLDDQLFGTFSRCHELIRQEPVQAESREELQEYLKVASGGVVFTTIQKFLPEDEKESYPTLSERHNIVVIADEAHRSQYGLKAKYAQRQDELIKKYGYAKYMRDALPNASFIGFTGTPIELEDRSTPEVFGNYIDIYDIEQAEKDGATVKIYYESRIAKLELRPEERPQIDPEFEEVTEGEEIERKEKLKTKWARMEALVGSENRIKKIAMDIVDHFENRLEVLDGKAMVVCMSRRICVDLHDELKKLRPDWYHEDDSKGFMKVIMTGSASDPESWQEHVRNKPKRKNLQYRMKDPDDPLKLAIVRDMWLTGFDVPSLHTMYIDKHMKGHTLMQAIARVNRVYKDKPGGLVVDYIGIAHDLKKALLNYTKSGGKGQPTFDKEKALKVMREKYEVVVDLLHGFDYQRFFTASSKEKMDVLAEAVDFVLSDEQLKDMFLKNVTALSKAFALAVPHEEASEIRDEVGFFQAVKSGINKATSRGGKTREELDSAVRQIISKAVVSGEVVDIFSSAGIEKPDISILSDEFLEEIKGMKYRNLALETLKKLLNDEIKTYKKKNLVKSRSFEEMLDTTISRYHNKAIETAQVIEELIDLAKRMKEAKRRGEDLALSDEELAFYDALEVNDSAVKVLGDETLRTIARELVETVRNNVTIDWTLRESVQAKLRVMVKRVLKKHGYPPDKQQKATEIVLEQAALIGKEWADT